MAILPANPTPPRPDAVTPAAISVCLVAACLAMGELPTVTSLHDESTGPTAIRKLLHLTAPDLHRARSGGYAEALSRVITGAGIPTSTRILAIRALAQINDPSRARSLLPFVQSNRQPEQIALAREAVIALRQLGAHDALSAALGATDPEVRATAAGAGPPDPQRLCMLLANDPWPRVRAAAARGLRRHPQAAGCLVPAFQDSVLSVALTALTTARNARPNDVRPALLRIAGDAQAELPRRVEAMVSLGALGDLTPAQIALQTHLRHGGIIPLAAAAVRAAQLSADESASVLLREALSSRSPEVLSNAIRAIVARKDRASLPALEAIATRVPPPVGRVLKAALIELAGNADPPPVAAEAPVDATE